MKTIKVTKTSKDALIKSNIRIHEHTMIKYNNHPKYCLQCNKIIEYKSRGNNFCNRTCSAIYNNAHRIFKQSDLRYERKQCNCRICNKEINISIWASPINATCNECKQIKKLNKCLVCGNITNTNKKYCENKLCYWATHNGLIPLRKLGAKIELLGTSAFLENIKLIVDSLYDQYINDGISSNMMAKQYGVHDMTILKTLKLYYSEFKVRTLSEAVSNAVIKGRLNIKNMNFISGWHTTWNNKQVFLRSGCEFEYAKFLDENKIEYEVEALRIPYVDIKGITRNYIPDFYIPKENKIIEVKGSYFMNENVNLKLAACNNMGYITELKIF